VSKVSVIVWSKSRAGAILKERGSSSSFDKNLAPVPEKNMLLLGSSSNTLGFRRALQVTVKGDYDWQKLW